MKGKMENKMEDFIKNTKLKGTIGEFLTISSAIE